MNVQTEIRNWELFPAFSFSLNVHVCTMLKERFGYDVLITVIYMWTGLTLLETFVTFL
jgi:hypothetical protein